MALNQTRDTILAVVSLTRQASTQAAELKSCEKIEAAVLGSPSLISLMVSVDVKQQSTTLHSQSSGAVRKLRRPSLAPRP